MSASVDQPPFGPDILRYTNSCSFSSFTKVGAKL